MKSKYEINFDLVDTELEISYHIIPGQFDEVSSSKFKTMWCSSDIDSYWSLLLLETLKYFTRHLLQVLSASARFKH